jgi:tRNA pseudouridine55 synthase
VHGEVIERSDLLPAEAAAREAALGLVGEIEQVPPMVSALKVGGERLYRLARRGVEVEREPRPVRVRSWEWLGFDGPSARFRVVCSGGTYVRTLAHDLGQRLGCGAALEQLRRLRSEPFGLEHAIDLSELNALDAATVWARSGLSLEEALAHLPVLSLTADEAAQVGFGIRPLVPVARVVGLPVGAGPRSIVLLEPQGRVLALGELAVAPEAIEVHGHVVFPWGAREGGPR